MTLPPGAFRNLLFPLASYPEASTVSAIDRAVAVAGKLEAHLSAIAFEMAVRLPAGIYADAYSMGDVIAAEYQRASSNARAVIGEFQEAAGRRAIGHDQWLEQGIAADVIPRVIELALISDLTLVAVKKGDSGQRD